MDIITIINVIPYKETLKNIFVWICLPEQELDINSIDL